MKKGTASMSSRERQSFNPKDYERPGISVEEVSQIREAFELFDYEGTGLIDSKELLNSLSSLGLQPKNQTLYNAVAKYPGSIDFANFFDLLTAYQGGKNSRANLQKVFSLFDDERSGFISIKNLRKVVRDVAENIDDSQLQEMIERADTDNDGLISEEEFYAIMTHRSLKI